MCAVEPLVVLLASPLLGPAVWGAAARALSAYGHEVLVPPAPASAPAGPDDVRAHLLAALPDRPLVLVPHSNAGLYVPGLGEDRDVVATVYVDAALAPSAGPAPLSPVAMRGFLAGLADGDGLLPPWTGWWDEADLAGLFPSEQVRAEVTAEAQRLPLAYFSATVPVPAGWTERPAAYLAFGDTYADERAQATAWGWPVRTLPGEHLHQLVDPRGVAAAVDELVRLLAP